MAMSKLSNFERAKAREKLRSAEAALKQTRDLLGDKTRPRGLGVNIALINKIRAAEKSVAEARGALRKIDPTFTD
jgi:hypothetical protein